MSVSLVCPEATLGRVRLSNDGGFKPSRLLPIAPTVTWTLPSGGDGSRTVYVRFPGSQATYSDDVILDRKKPHVTRASAQRLVGSGTPRIRVLVSGADGRSGIGRLEVSLDRRHVRGAAPRGHAIDIRTRSTRAWVRVRDRAGNASAWLALPLPN